MNSTPFFRYFFMYIFKARTRQRLLFIAVFGLFLSAFSLMVIQGIMAGLQHGLIQRSKAVHGSHVIQLEDGSEQATASFKEKLRKENILFISELEVEVMLKHNNYVAPAKLHGIDLNEDAPAFLKGRDFKGLVMGAELAAKIKAQFLDDVQIIAPGITDSMMGEVPRFISESISDYVYTELMEVDEFDLYARLGLAQNLMRSASINQIRLYGNLKSSQLEMLQKHKPEGSRWMTWEDMNAALVWSLNLETKVMMFLFISMSLLVAIAITSGLLIFYSKIRRDLMSFWILGMAPKKLLSLSLRFTLILSAATCLLGGIFGLVTLKLLESFGHDIMPAVFVERQLPIQLNLGNIVLSIVIPFAISLVFSWFSFLNFRKENQSFVSIVRSLS